MKSKRPRHIIIKLQKAKDKKRNLERSKRKATYHIEEILNTIISRFLIRHFGSQRQWAYIFKVLKEKKTAGDFPSGPVVKNLPSNAGDAGSIPGQGTKIPHAVGQLSPRTATTEPTHSRARVPQLDSPCATTTEPTHSGAMHHNQGEAYVLQREKPARRNQRSLHVTTREAQAPQQKIPHAATKIPHAATKIPCAPTKT